MENNNQKFKWLDRFIYMLNEYELPLHDMEEKLQTKRPGTITDLNALLEPLHSGFTDDLKNWSAFQASIMDIPRESDIRTTGYHHVFSLN